MNNYLCYTINERKGSDYIMILPIISWCCVFAFPFFMWFTVKRLTEIRDILKELKIEAKSKETDL